LTNPGMTTFGQDFQSVKVVYNDGSQSKTINAQLPEAVR
jgi:hypothetical protein